MSRAAADVSIVSRVPSPADATALAPFVFLVGAGTAAWWACVTRLWLLVSSWRGLLLGRFQLLARRTGLVW